MLDTFYNPIVFSCMNTAFIGGILAVHAAIAYALCKVIGFKADPRSMRAHVASFVAGFYFFVSAQSVLSPWIITVLLIAALYKMKDLFGYCCIISRKLFVVNDVIRIHNFEGKVVKISCRITTLEHKNELIKIHNFMFCHHTVTVIK